VRNQASTVGHRESRVGSVVTARVYLVRHGQTAHNVADELRGRLDPPLDVVGWRQASGVSFVVLGHRRIDMIVTSPLRRAMETAETVARAAGLRIETDARLIDRDYGPWAGIRKEVVEERWGSLDAAPGVEPAEQVHSRARAALTDIARRAAGGVAVVVSHDAVIRYGLVALVPELGDPASLRRDTGCINVLECERLRWRVLGINQLPASAPVGAILNGAARS
jgi:broad specificity phosphatase PhoE